MPPDTSPDKPVHEAGQPPVYTVVQPDGHPDKVNGELSALRELVDVLREQLGKAEADRARLFDLVVGREGEAAGLAARAAAAERRAVEAEASLAGGLAEVRAMVATLQDAQQSVPKARSARPQRRGLLARLIGR